MPWIRLGTARPGASAAGRGPEGHSPSARLGSLQATLRLQIRFSPAFRGTSEASRDPDGDLEVPVHVGNLGRDAEPPVFGGTLVFLGPWTQDFHGWTLPSPDKGCLASSRVCTHMFSLVAWRAYGLDEEQKPLLLISDPIPSPRPFSLLLSPDGFSSAKSGPCASGRAETLPGISCSIT